MAWQEKMYLDAKQLEAHEKQWGLYNDFPPGWRKITAGEFAQSLFFAFHPQVVEHRQMVTRNDDGFTIGMTNATLFFFHENVGYAIVNDFWGKKITYYAFGCDQPHQNRHTCPKCGFKADYDTSD